MEQVTGSRKPVGFYLLSSEVYINLRSGNVNARHPIIWENAPHELLQELLPFDANRFHFLRFKSETSALDYLANTFPNLKGMPAVEAIVHGYPLPPKKTSLYDLINLSTRRGNQNMFMAGAVAASAFQWTLLLQDSVYRSNFMEKPLINMAAVGLTTIATTIFAKWVGELFYRSTRKIDEWCTTDQTNI